MASLPVVTFGLVILSMAMIPSASLVAQPTKPDIVLYAREAISSLGWSFVNDATAADGRRLFAPSQSSFNLETPPPADTAPTVTFTFSVPVTDTYRLWMRMRGADDSKFNESVWVQFSDATQNGTPAYRWGTNEALLINLEDCSACGIQNWGWQDNAWWLRDSSAVQLAAGTHTVYVTVREDGVSFDQIVLSPQRYAAAAPGELKDDTTIVAKPVQTSDIVLYARDVAALHMVQRIGDPSAAGGQKITSENNGVDFLDEPPEPNLWRATFAFNVREPGRYRLWLRMRGQDDSKWNESVWVHFSHARRNGVPVYQWGTEDGLLVNLENCSGCGISGWGWQDNSWWRNQSSAVDLSPGIQFIYISIREDGVEFDQIVLSKDRYANTAPGALKNDTTIVPRPFGPERVRTVGTFNFEDRVGRLDIEGGSGFSLNAVVDAASGATSDGVFGRCGVDCPAGQWIPLTAHWSGGDLPGTATYLDNSYNNLGGVGSDHSAEFNISGYVLMPPRDPSFTTGVPVTIAGRLSYSDDGGATRKSVEYVGGGVAIFHLEYSDANQSWSIRLAELTFDQR